MLPFLDILVYIESIDRANKTVLLDFVDSVGFGDFQSLLGRERNYSGPSMVLLRNYSGKRVQQNTIYSISEKTVTELNSQNLIHSYGVSDNAKEVGQDSFVVGYSIDLGNQSEFFGRTISLGEKFFGENESDQSREFLSWINDQTFGNLTAVVRDVGHGNWNELWRNETLLILFDGGAPSLASKAEVIRHIGARDSIIRNCSPGLIISHWDLDHYHALVGMSDETLARFSYVICRNNPPTRTGRELHARLTNHLTENRIFNIVAEAQVKRKVPLKLLSDPSDSILLFNSHYHKDRNRSGILLAIRNSRSSIVFSGDAHYSQISDYILPHLQYPHAHHLVVPHHGGTAGKFIYNYRKIMPGSAIISVGTNSYKHPNEANISNLHQLRFSVSQTRFKKQDITITL
jgi:beta-lactamase superfamily II metal-dependent hydrolase